MDSGDETPATIPRRPRRGLRNGRLVWVTVVGLVVLGGLVAAAWAYDHGRRNLIAAGVHAGPVQLGGLSAPAARQRLDRVFATRARRRIVLVAGDQRLDVVPVKVGIEVDVGRMVSTALAASRTGSFISRGFRSITGGELHTNVSAEFVSRSATALRRLARRLDRSARNASVQAAPAGLRVVRSRIGTVVTAGALQRTLTGALLSGSARARVAVRRVPPTVTTAVLARRYPSYITIDRSGFTLRVYRHLRLARSYRIAVGMQGLETPTGLYHIQNKVVDPSWSVPNSPWAGSLAGQVIPPGPSDPVKAMDGTVERRRDPRHR